ncbi:MAG: fasciclin domain-containing protein, partial [Leptolyngbyaceae bacterium]|nr:fasciclin domain-containing protein [Leptolyngbyaceae bacterium]
MKNGLKLIVSLASTVTLGWVISLPAIAQVIPVPPATQSPDTQPQVIPDPSLNQTPDSQVPNPQTPGTQPQVIPDPSLNQTPDSQVQPLPSASSSAGTESMSISKLTQEIGEFEMFSALIPVADLEGAKLSETLTQEGSYTVFVPTDKAFAALPREVLSTLVKPENRQLLVQILSYHIVPSKITSEEIKTGEVTSLEGQPIAIQTDGAVGSVMVNEA